MLRDARFSIKEVRSLLRAGARPRAWRPFAEQRLRQIDAQIAEAHKTRTHTDGHTNLNHVAIFHDWRVCKAYRREFDQIEQGQFGRGMHGPVPEVINIKGVPVKILFAPDHTPELEIMKQINKCEKRLDFAIFTFTGSSGIDDSMIMASRAKRKVRSVLDPGQAKHDFTPLKWLHDAGVKLYLPKRIKPFRKLHHKLMVIDDAIVVAGSFNYTAPTSTTTRTSS